MVSPGPMGVLMGMAVGGLVMSGTKAAISLSVSSILFGVRYQTGSLLLLALVFDHGRPLRNGHDVCFGVPG